MAFWDEQERKAGRWASNIGVHTFKVIKDNIPMTVRARTPSEAKHKAMQYLIVAKFNKKVDEVA
jgi:hypothetical protein